MTVGKMTDQRWKELERSGKGLTEEEQLHGWHWCPDWDDMLVGPGMFAQEGCLCKSTQTLQRREKPLKHRAPKTPVWRRLMSRFL